MPTIWARTETALTGLSVPMAANRYLVASTNQLPDLFMVYQLISSPPELSADNVEKYRTYRMQVTVWNRSGLNALPDVAAAMVAAGFCRGPIRELPYEESTRHFGLAMEFTYLEEAPTPWTGETLILDDGIEPDDRLLLDGI